MIEYVAEYIEGSQPNIYKQLDQNGEILMRSIITFNNVEELSQVSDDVIYQHIENIISYMKYVSLDLKIVPEGTAPRDGWPLMGWANLYRLNSQITEWWNYVEFRDDSGNPPPGTIVIS